MNETPLTHFRTMLDQAPYGMALVDGDGAVLLANARFADVVHANGSGATGRIQDHLPPSPGLDWRCLAAGEPFVWEGRIDCRGCANTLRVCVCPTPEPGANLVTVIDLTSDPERLAAALADARHELAALDSYYQTILDNAPDGVLVTDCAGVVRVWSVRMESMFGVSGGDMVGRCLFDDMEFWQSHSAAFQRVLDTREPVRIERRPRLNHEGKAVVESIGFTPLFRNGVLDGVLGRVTDASEQAELEKQLVKSERMAAVGELAAGVAHNFNNILAGIGGDAQLLRMIAEEDNLGETVINSADMIYRETMRGGRIAHDLLSFARGQEPCLSEVDVSAVVAEAIRLAKTYPQAAGVDLRPQIQAGLPRVSADPNQVHQVFFNIILNAIQAMPHGGTLTIDARIAHGEDGRPLMETSFQDTGVGIPEELLTRIFDPFFTNRRSGTMGTGLGLSVSQSMVRGMDGDIRVESEVGHGTVMTVVLPIVERRRRPRSGETPKTRILFADDEATVRRTVSTFLSRRGYHVVSARDGVEAIGILEDPEADFRLAIMDLVMPRLDGPNAIRRVHELRPDLPIIVLTGVAGSDDLEKVKALGVRCILAKPVDFDNLLRTVETLAGAAAIPVLTQG